jgi:hypothetical protein
MTQPIELRLADDLEKHVGGNIAYRSAAALRRLHEVNQELVEAVEMCINNPWRKGTMEYDVLMQVARAALAKAKGEE